MKVQSEHIHQAAALLRPRAKCPYVRTGEASPAVAHYLAAVDRIVQGVVPGSLAHNEEHDQEEPVDLYLNGAGDLFIVSEDTSLPITPDRLRRLAYGGLALADLVSPENPPSIAVLEEDEGPPVLSLWDPESTPGITVANAGEVGYLRVSREGWSYAEVPHPFVIVDRAEDGSLIGVAFHGPAAQALALDGLDGALTVTRDHLAGVRHAVDPAGVPDEKLKDDGSWRYLTKAERDSINASLKDLRAEVKDSWARNYDRND